MISLTAIIIEDEKNARESLASLLTSYCPNVHLIGQASTIEEGSQLIQEQHPDVVFLDVALGDRNGFELLDKINVLDFRIIFTTAHSEFATTAFRYNAIDYLLKPVDPFELKEAIAKISTAQNLMLLQKQVANLATALQNGKNAKLTIKTQGTTHFVNVDEILHVEGSGAYSTFVLCSGEKILASKNLKHYYDLLPKNVFFRSHQSHLVNITFIKKIISEDGHIIEMQNGSAIPLVQHRKDGLMKLIER